MNLKLKLNFVSDNKEKIADINSILSSKVNLNFISNIHLLEIQSLDVSKVCSHKAEQAYKLLNEPVAVSDSGLEITALNRFPGALVKFVNETIGQKGILKLLEGSENRQVFFVAAIAYCDKKGLKVFVEKDEGTIATEIKGKGWHFDMIFIPIGEGRTWAEIGREKKNQNSAFRRALEKMSASLNEK